MAQFLADIAGMLEIFSIAAGLVLLHYASKQPAAKLLKAAGIVLVVGGIVVGVCTSMYWFQYRANGQFQTVDVHSQLEPGAMQGAHAMTETDDSADAP